jgi:hypothetical protein
LFGEDVVYEAGNGQATLVFESEQGVHDTIRAVKGSGTFSFDSSKSGGEVTEIVGYKLRRLVEVYDEFLACQSYGLCRRLGIEAISIEGYYDDAVSRLSIVDVDLPFDVVFMGTSAPL